MTLPTIRCLSGSLILVAAFVNAYHLGQPAVNGSCAEPECDEVILAMELADLATAPPTTIKSSDIYDHDQALKLYSPGPLGGTATPHATLKNKVKRECSYWWRNKCPGNTTDGLYETDILEVPLVNTCKPAVEVDRTFCAGEDGEGVSGSWHAGRKKDEAPATSL